MLTCSLYRRRLGAWLDGALDERRARATAGHVRACARCARDVGDLRRLASLLATVPPPADPDWTGFWPGVVRGIQDARVSGAPRRPLESPRRPFAWLRPRWAYGGAVTAALLVSLTVWQLVPSPLPSEAPVIVRSADTGDPHATVMVYSTPERDLTIVWVFGLE